MLFQVTMLVNLCALAICLWMAFYLFARGYPNRITLRAVIVMLALSAYFMGAFNNMFHQTTGTAAWRAVFLIIALGAWHSITFNLLPESVRASIQVRTMGFYLFGVITAIALLTIPNSFVGEQGNVLYAAKMGAGFQYTMYSIFLAASSIGMLYNLLSHNKIGLTPQGRYFLLASIFPSLQIINGIISLGFIPNEPRVIGDFLVFSGVFFLGISVARYQTWTERRTILQDFPASTLIVLSAVTLYTFLALRLGLPLELVAKLVAFVVLTHGAYDIMREFLERSRIQKESAFRRQLRKIGSGISNEATFKFQLQNVLNNVCETLNASSGLIGIRQGEEFIVAASQASVPVESRISASLLFCEDLSKPKDEEMSYLEWIAPSFEGQTQVAVIGIGKPKGRIDYSSGNLDLLAEIADLAGTLISLNAVSPQRETQIRQLVTQSQTDDAELNSIAGDIMDTLAVNPDAEFIKIVEEGLRHVSDVITLGQSVLADKLEIKGESHIERGKKLQQIIFDSIESLKPAEKRPSEPLPRIWYNHAVLHDAYVEGVLNREIMARLYISEGTFNRTRRNALRGLARLLIENKK